MNSSRPPALAEQTNEEWGEQIVSRDLPAGQRLLAEVPAAQGEHLAVVEELRRQELEEALAALRFHPAASSRESSSRRPEEMPTRG